MKEVRLFYAPALQAECGGALLSLPEEEAAHAVRVLRMKTGDALFLTNGCGLTAEAEVAEADKRGLRVRVGEISRHPRTWRGSIHVAVAPTKHIDRIEWFMEKAAEIGVNRITLVETKNTERSRVNMERLERILLSAMKQSHSAWRTELTPEVQKLNTFLAATARASTKPSVTAQQERFIAYCAEGDDLLTLSTEHHLFQHATPDGESIVLIGPEGDFTQEELQAATAQGWQQVSLGAQRLRTETAALVAAHTLSLVHSALRYAVGSEE